MPVPSGFDDALRLAIHAKLQKYHEQFAAAWQEFNGAWAGLMYRFSACADHDEEFRASLLRASDAPQPPERYLQERHLFEFFVTGLSAIECLCYGLHAIGSMKSATAFPMTDKDLRGVSPESTSKRFLASFPHDQLTVSLGQLVASAEFLEWKDVRNVLAHRAHPGRAFSVGSTDDRTRWLNGMVIDANTTASRRRWLAEALRLILKGTESFVDSQL